MVSYTQIRIRPRRPLGAANSETVAVFVGCWRVQRSDLIRRSPSLGAANCETVATFVCFWGAHRRDVLRGSE